MNLFTETLLKHDESDIFNVKLPRKTSMFIKTKDEIYEMMQFNEKNRCFFIENTVSSNGKIYTATKIDPIFIFIQFLEEHCKLKAQPLDQLLENDSIIFLDFLKLNQMKMVADQKGPDDLKAFLYNEEKTLKWLKIKFGRIQKSLREQNIIFSGIVSSNFIQSPTVKEENEDEIAATALGIISEYISLDLYEKLDTFYGISEKSKEPIVQKRKSNANDNEPDSKKFKTEYEDILRQSNPVKPQGKITAKTAKMEKAAKGTKSINSFFTKK